jgi:tetratricopeptide (TPR) repeat protein
MIKKTAILFLMAFSLFLNEASGASNFEEFNNFIQKNDLKHAKAVLDKWGGKKENDPQYYICLFNYHINKARTEGIGVQKRPPKDDKTIEITDPKTKETVGYFAPVVHYDEGEAQQGIDYLKQGVSKFPDHYEMRFGLLYIYKELQQFKNYLAELDSGLRYYKKNNPKKIYWNNNKIIDDPAEFIIETAQGNLSGFMEDEDSGENKDFEHKYCDLLIKYFPEHKYGYSDKGVIYYQHKDFNHALEYFLKAYKLDPEDELIAFNLGFLYKEMNDRENAKKYFKRALEIGKDESIVLGAKEQLKLLGSKEK